MNEPRFTYKARNVGGSVESWRAPVEPATPVEEPRTYAQRLLIDLPEKISDADIALRTGDIEKGRAIMDEIRTYRKEHEAALTDFAHFRGSNPLGRRTAGASLRLLSLEHEREWASLLDPRTNPAYLQRQAMVQGWGPRTTEMMKKATEGDAQAQAFVSASQTLTARTAGTAHGRGAAGTGVFGSPEEYFGYATRLRQRVASELPEEIVSGLTPTDWAELSKSGFEAGERDSSMAFTNNAMKDVGASSITNPRDVINVYKSTMSTINTAVRDAAAYAGIEDSDDPLFRSMTSKVIGELAELSPGSRIVDNRGTLQAAIRSAGMMYNAARGAGRSLSESAFGAVARIQAVKNSGGVLSDTDRKIDSGVGRLDVASSGITKTPLTTGLTPAEQEEKQVGVSIVQTPKGPVEQAYPRGVSSLEHHLKSALSAAKVDVYNGEDIYRAAVRGYAPLSESIINNTEGKINKEAADSLAKLIIVSTIRNGGIDLNNLADGIRRAEPGLVKQEIAGMGEDKSPVVDTAGMSEVEAAVARTRASGSEIDIALVQKLARLPVTWDILPGTGPLNRMRKEVSKAADRLTDVLFRPETAEGAGSAIYKFIRESRQSDIKDAPDKVKAGAKKAFMNQVAARNDKVLSLIPPAVLSDLADKVIDRQIAAVRINMPPGYTFDSRVADMFPTGSGPEEMDKIQKAMSQPTPISWGGSTEGPPVGVPSTPYNARVPTLPGVSLEDASYDLAREISSVIESKARENGAETPEEIGNAIRRFAVREFAAPSVRKGAGVETGTRPATTGVSVVDDILNPLTAEREPTADGRYRDIPSSVHPALSLDNDFNAKLAMTAADIFTEQARTKPEPGAINDVKYTYGPAWAKEANVLQYEYDSILQDVDKHQKSGALKTSTDISQFIKNSIRSVSQLHIAEMEERLAARKAKNSEDIFAETE